MLGGADTDPPVLFVRALVQTTPMDTTPDKREMLVLGIETSCDETAAAVARAPDGGGRILSNVVRAQWEEHRRYGGVVPEIAARAHVECLDEIVAGALREAGVALAHLVAVAGDGRAGTDWAACWSGPRPPKRWRWCTSCHWLPSITWKLTRSPSASRKACTALSAVAGLRRAHPAPGRARRRPLPAARHHHRRCPGEAFDKTAKLLGSAFPADRRWKWRRAPVARDRFTRRGRCSAGLSRISPSPQDRRGTGAGPNSSSASRT